MSVELLSVCQLIIKALLGLHEISKHIILIMYNILYMKQKYFEIFSVDLDITDHDGSHVPHKLNNRGRFVKRRPHNSSQSAPSKLKAKYQWHNRADEGGDAG